MPQRRFPFGPSPASIPGSGPQALPDPSRREALKLTAASLAAVTKPVLPGAPLRSDLRRGDATLIKVCDQVVTLAAECSALARTHTSVEDEDLVDVALDRLSEAQAELFAYLQAFPRVTTFSGVLALAQASLAMAPRNHEGHLLVVDDPEGLAFYVLEILIAHSQ